MISPWSTGTSITFELTNQARNTWPQEKALTVSPPGRIERRATMADQTNTQAPYQAAEPNPDLKSLETLVGTWNLSGDAKGEVTYEWMEGSFFLLQHVDMNQGGHIIKGLEIIGHLKPFLEEPGEDIKSRFYSSTGDTLDYVYELNDNTSRSGAARKVPRPTTGERLALMEIPAQAAGSIPAAATPQP
jgi:hypothetical protein